MSQIVLYFLQSTSVVSFYIDVVLTLYIWGAISLILQNMCPTSTLSVRICIKWQKSQRKYFIPLKHHNQIKESHSRPHSLCNQWLYAVASNILSVAYLFEIVYVMAWPYTGSGLISQSISDENEHYAYVFRVAYKPSTILHTHTHDELFPYLIRYVPNINSVG